MELKKFMKGIGIHIQDLSPKEQMQLCVARLSVDDLPKLSDVMEEKVRLFLETVPAPVRSSYSDAK